MTKNEFCGFQLGANIVCEPQNRREAFEWVESL